MRLKLSKLLMPAVAAVIGLTIASAAQADKITLHGASQFDERHAFTRLMRKFEQLTKLYYSGEHEIEFIMHLNSELGLEKDYVAYMNQGISVDYAVASPSHMSTFSKMATLLDPPMLYRARATGARFFPVMCCSPSSTISTSVPTFCCWVMAAAACVI